MAGGGNFTRWFNTSTIADGSITGLFPVGTLANYNPFSVSAPTDAPSTGGTIALAYTDDSTTTLVSVPDGVFTIQVRKNLFWTVAAGNGLAGGTYDLDASGTDFGTVGSVNDLRLMLVNSVVGTAGINGGSNTDPQVNRTSVSIADISNSFYIGSTNIANSPLPISLMYFTAYPVNGLVKLDWETSAEVNNENFTILRSTNAASWENLQTIPGAGNTSVDTKYSAFDNHPYTGISYYRLQQTDQNGRQTYSSVVSVDMGAATAINVYPNPAADYIFLTTIGSGKLDVSVYNSNGQQMDVLTTINNNSATLNISTLQSATYFIHIIQDGNLVTKSFIKR
jgi:Secretion system C-terminal sorting domain